MDVYSSAFFARISHPDTLKKFFFVATTGTALFTHNSASAHSSPSTIKVLCICNRMGFKGFPLCYTHHTRIGVKGVVNQSVSCLSLCLLALRLADVSDVAHLWHWLEEAPEQDPSLISAQSHCFSNQSSEPSRRSTLLLFTCVV